MAHILDEFSLEIHLELVFDGPLCIPLARFHWKWGPAGTTFPMESGGDHISIGNGNVVPAVPHFQVFLVERSPVELRGTSRGGNAFPYVFDSIERKPGRPIQPLEWVMPWIVPNQ